VLHDLNSLPNMIAKEEQLLCFYLSSLLLLGEDPIVLRIIKKFLSRFSQCSPTFRANVHRAKAYALINSLPHLES
jgi:hypothetical protein